jgi:hypothetical protein
VVAATVVAVVGAAVVATAAQVLPLESHEQSAFARQSFAFNPAQSALAAVVVNGGASTSGVVVVPESGTTVRRKHNERCVLHMHSLTTLQDSQVLLRAHSSAGVGAGGVGVDGGCPTVAGVGSMHDSDGLSHAHPSMERQTFALCPAHDCDVVLGAGTVVVAAAVVVGRTVVVVVFGGASHRLLKLPEPASSVPGGQLS